MQYGSRGSSKGLYLCTDSFTHDDVKRLSQYLINNYDIKCSIHKAGKNFRIYILVQSIETINFVCCFLFYPPPSLKDSEGYDI